MGKFKVGQKVVALSNPPNERCQFRVKGQIYIVNLVIYCSGCGLQMINIGQPSYGNGKLITKCCKVRIENEGYGWTKAKHFAPLEEDSEEAKNTNLESILQDLDIEILQN